MTWCDEIGTGSIDADAARLAVPRDGDLVPGAVVDSTRRSLHFDAARAQIQVKKDVAADEFHGKVVSLEFSRA